MVCWCFSLRVTSLSFTVCSAWTFLALAVPVTPPLSCHVLFLQRGHTIIVSHFSACMWREVGGGWSAEEAEPDQRPRLGEPGSAAENSCPSLSLPLVQA